MVQLDREHYLLWIAEQLDKGTTENEIIMKLRLITNNKYANDRYRSYINDARRLKQRLSKRRKSR